MEIPKLFEKLERHGIITALIQDHPKEEFKDVTNVIILSSDHSCALNFKCDEPISRKVANDNYQSDTLTSYLCVRNLQRLSV